MFKKRSFFQKLTGGLSLRDVEDEISDDETSELPEIKERDEDDLEEWQEVEEIASELSLDVYQTPEEIVVKAFAAGVKPEDLDIDISRDMVTIIGE